MINQEIITIEYTAYQDKNYNKAFKPTVFVNGKWVYTISRAKKTMKGALNAAKKSAEEIAETYPSNAFCIAIVKERE